MLVSCTKTANTMANSCHNVFFVSYSPGRPVTQTVCQDAQASESANLGKNKHAHMVLQLLLLLLMLLLMQLLLLLQLMLMILWMLLHQLLDYPYCNSINASEPCNYLTTASDNSVSCCCCC